MGVTVKYDLYALPYSAENEEAARKERFHRINGRYILVYKSNDNVETENDRYHIISEEETSFLSDAEKVWLLECNIEIITEESVKQRDEIIKNYSLKLERLEAELEKEAKNIEQGKG